MPRKLVLGVIAATLSLGMIAAPVAAQDTADVALLNGLPNKIELCMGKTEVVSKLRYGQAVLWDDIDANTYRFVIRLAKAGTCTGRKLGAVTVTWLGGQDHTSVIWKPKDTLLATTFTNDNAVPPGQSTVVVRHAASVPSAVNVWIWEQVRVAADDWSPTIANLRRGRSADAMVIRPGQFYVDMYPTKKTKRFSYEGYWSRTDPEQVREVYLVGTNKQNAKVVSIYGAGTVVTP